MKKILAVLFALLMILPLCSCGGKDGTAAIKIGETITTENYELTLESVQIGYSVRCADGSSLSNSDGKPLILVDVSVKNLSKNAVNSRKCFTFTADYNDGYTYEPDFISRSFP